MFPSFTRWFCILMATKLLKKSRFKSNSLKPSNQHVIIPFENLRWLWWWNYHRLCFIILCFSCFPCLKYVDWKNIWRRKTYITFNGLCVANLVKRKEAKRCKNDGNSSSSMSMALLTFSNISPTGPGHRNISVLTWRISRFLNITNNSQMNQRIPQKGFHELWIIRLKSFLMPLSFWINSNWSL